jgi:Protein of unknown function (DUF2802)
MMNNELFTLYTLTISIGLLLGAACIAILRFQRITLETRAFWNSPTGSAMQADEASLHEKREKQLETRLQALQKLVDELSKRDRAAELQSPPQALPFENAIRMAKQGASIDDLTRSCGLSVGEAQLIRRMHGCRAA